MTDIKTEPKVGGKLKLTPQTPFPGLTPGDPPPPNIAYPVDGDVSVNGVPQTQLPHPPAGFYHAGAIR